MFLSIMWLAGIVTVAGGRLLAGLRENLDFEDAFFGVLAVLAGFALCLVACSLAPELPRV